MAFNSVNFDRAAELDVRNVLAPAVHTTAQDGAIIDTVLANNDRAKTVTFLVNVGVVTDGTISLAFTESDNADMSSSSAIPATRVFSDDGEAVPTFTSSTDETTTAVSVVPYKRYVRVATVEDDASAGYAMSIVALVEAA